MNLIFLFFFNDTATTEIYTLSLHDALPISGIVSGFRALDSSAGEIRARLRPDLVPGEAVQEAETARGAGFGAQRELLRDRKSTRLNSSHSQISYAVFCLKKKNNAINSFTIA